MLSNPKFPNLSLLWNCRSPASAPVINFKEGHYEPQINPLCTTNWCNEFRRLIHLKQRLFVNSVCSWSCLLAGQLRIYLARCHLGDKLTLSLTFNHIPLLNSLNSKKIHTHIPLKQSKLKKNPRETTLTSSIWPGGIANWLPFAQICPSETNSICMCVTFLETGVLVKTLCPKLPPAQVFAPFPKKRLFEIPGRLRCADGLWTVAAEDLFGKIPSGHAAPWPWPTSKEGKILTKIYVSWKNTKY